MTNGTPYSRRGTRGAHGSVHRIAPSSVCPCIDRIVGRKEGMARILVISEQNSIAGFVRTVLENAGHVVTVAPTAVEGGRLLREGDVQVILADLRLPECKDPCVIATWREEFQAVKIIVFSDRPIMADFLALRLMGADDVLRMPLGSEELLLAVRTALDEEG
jgi:DNA-binding response OmpR family regulator